MTDRGDELEQLRETLDQARDRHERDRITIERLGCAVDEDRREAQHQIRNILAIVRSLARRTVEEGETAEDYQARLDSRLASFTRLQSQILRDPKRGIDLCTLVDDELLAFGIKLDQQAYIEGMPVRLRPKPASVLGLAFHELARMAIEGGASTGLDGRIDVRWQIERDGNEPDRIEIMWLETGRQARVSPRPEPTFGREVVEQAVTYEIGGTVQLDVTDDGLRCRFDLPALCLLAA